MILEVRYSTFEGVKFAYFQGDCKTAKFYKSWLDCKEQNGNTLDSFESDRIRSALNKFYGN